MTMRRAFLFGCLTTVVGLALPASPSVAGASLRPSLSGHDRAASPFPPMADGFAERAFRQGFVRIEMVERSRHGIEIRGLRPTGEVLRMRLDPRTGRLLESERVGWRSASGLVPSHQVASPNHGRAADRYGPVR